jgi:hypothetical protein
MSRKSKREENDVWQMSIRTTSSGLRNGFALELYNPIVDQHLVVEIWAGEVSRKPLNSTREYALRLASKFEKKLIDQGMEIPNLRERLLDLVKQKWRLG